MKLTTIPFDDGTGWYRVAEITEARICEYKDGLPCAGIAMVKEVASACNFHCPGPGRMLVFDHQIPLIMAKRLEGE